MPAFAVRLGLYALVSRNFATTSSKTAPVPHKIRPRHGLIQLQVLRTLLWKHLWEPSPSCRCATCQTSSSSSCSLPQRRCLALVPRRSGVVVLTNDIPMLLFFGGSLRRHSSRFDFKSGFLSPTLDRLLRAAKHCESKLRKPSQRV